MAEDIESRISIVDYIFTLTLTLWLILWRWPQYCDWPDLDVLISPRCCDFTLVIWPWPLYCDLTLTLWPDHDIVIWHWYCVPILILCPDIYIVIWSFKLWCWPWYCDLTLTLWSLLDKVISPWSCDPHLDIVTWNWLTLTPRVSAWCWSCHYHYAVWHHLWTTRILVPGNQWSRIVSGGSGSGTGWHYPSWHPPEHGRLEKEKKTDVIKSFMDISCLRYMWNTSVFVTSCSWSRVQHGHTKLGGTKFQFLFVAIQYYMKLKFIWAVLYSHDPCVGPGIKNRTIEIPACRNSSRQGHVQSNICTP